MDSASEQYLIFGGGNMKIGEYKQVSTKTVQRVVDHAAVYGDDGNIIANAWSETVDVEVPVMGMVYRDATQEEIEEMERQKAEIPEPEPTPEERMEAQVLYTALMTDTLLEV